MQKKILCEKLLSRWKISLSRWRANLNAFLSPGNSRNRIIPKNSLSFSFSLLTTRTTVVAGGCSEGYYCKSGMDRPKPDGNTSDLTSFTLWCYDGSQTGYGGQCTPGHYCPRNTTDPIPCPNGTYAAVYGKAACDVCEPGAQEAAEGNRQARNQHGTPGVVKRFLRGAQNVSERGPKLCPTHFSKWAEKFYRGASFPLRLPSYGPGNRVEKIIQFLCGMTFVAAVEKEMTSFLIPFWNCDRQCCRVFFIQRQVITARKAR